MEKTKNCVLCSRYTNDRKIYTVTTGSLLGRTGVICDYCKEHGRIEYNKCTAVNNLSKQELV